MKAKRSASRILPPGSTGRDQSISTSAFHWLRLALAYRSASLVFSMRYDQSHIASIGECIFSSIAAMIGDLELERHKLLHVPGIILLAARPPARPAPMSW